MKITKAVIPAAGFGTRVLPATKSFPKEMFPIVDKPTIQYIVEEAVQAGITDILIITNRGKGLIEDHFDRSPELEQILERGGKTEFLELVRSISDLANIHFIRQKEMKGLGHAILKAKPFVGNEPFAVLFGDGVIISKTQPAIGQLMAHYGEYGEGVVGVCAKSRRRPRRCSRSIRSSTAVCCRLRSLISSNTPRPASAVRSS